MAFYTYILRSQTTGRFYVGHTESLSKRIAEHNNRTVSIRNRGPWELVYRDRFPRFNGQISRLCCKITYLSGCENVRSRSKISTS